MTTQVSAASGSADQAWSAMMAAAQAGDRGAYQALLRDCVPHVKRVARRSGVRPENLDDVVQDVLLTIHRARQTFDPGRSFTAWLTAIAHRRAIDSLRRRGRLDRREVADDLRYESFADASANPEASWEGAGRDLQLKGAIAALPPRQREAVESLALRQLSLTEASDLTGKTKGSLKVNLHRALKALRARFEGTE